MLMTETLLFNALRQRIASLKTHVILAYENE